MDVNFRLWSTRTLAMAPFPFLVHLTIFLFFRHRPDFALIALAVSAATVLTVVAVIFLSNRSAMRLVPSDQRRHVHSVWTGHLIGFLLVPVVILTLAPPRQPSDLLIIYPLWVILAAMTFFSLGSNAGILYVVGAGCFVLVFLILWEPLWAPVEVGLFMSANLTAQGLFLRRLGSESGGADGATSVSTLRPPRGPGSAPS
jgi:hypothetical protein